jgi:alkylation response protein AidB-like acyl-CoA dehydrogenase
MDFSINEDQLALRDAVKRFCTDEYPTVQRGNVSSAQATKQRRVAMAELGLLGLPFSTDVGGSELGAIEIMLVSQELGEALGDGAFVTSTVMAGHLMHQLGSISQQQRWLPAMSRGELLMSVAVYESTARYEWQHCATHVTSSDSGWILNGHKTLVMEGDSADMLLVVARTEGGIADRAGLSVFAVDIAESGVVVQGFDTLDNRRAAHVTFNNVQLDEDRLLGEIGKAAEAVEAALDAATAALCAEAVGAVDALLAHTAAHLRTRKQFGSPLAKFQVLQHRVADIAISLEHLKSMACAAAMAVQAGDPAQRRRLVSAAKVLASQKGREIGMTTIQLHGAMGMTDECRVGHYVKRLMVIGQTLGDAAWHLQRLRTSNTL